MCVVCVCVCVCVCALVCVCQPCTRRVGVRGVAYVCLMFVEPLRLCGSSAGSTTKFVPRLMVCWRCGQWVEDARWVRITGQCTARATDVSKERLLAYYNDGAGDTWVTECHPSCEAQLLLRRIRKLKARFTPIPKLVSQDLAEILSLAETVVAEYAKARADLAW